LRSYLALLFGGARSPCQSDVAYRLDYPYQFGSFLKGAEADQAQVLAELANQEELYLAFFGGDCQCGELVGLL
jgi:hypothetical protein